MASRIERIAARRRAGRTLNKSSLVEGSEIFFAKSTVRVEETKSCSKPQLNAARENNNLGLARSLKQRSSQCWAMRTAHRRREKETFVMTNVDRQNYEFSGESEAFEAEQFEWTGEAEWGGETEVFSEAEVMELAGELLEVSNENELDHFLGDLIKKAGHALGQAIHTPVGQAIGSLLKGAAKKALPLAGAALGGMVGGPLGAQIGSGLAGAAGNALGLEAEAEDHEFEGAKNFVKMAGDTVRSTLAGDPGAVPLALAKAALAAAAEKHAPALLAPRGTGAEAGHASGRVGRWVRQGRNIIIVNCPPGRP
jgi:hypothetical protein